MKRLDELEHFLDRAASIGDSAKHSRWVRDLGIEARRLVAQRDNWSWECNECGSEEFTGTISAEDLENLSCTNCGANEFHKVGKP